MKRVLAIVVLLAIVGVSVFVAQHYEPRRERPEGWRAKWDALPLDDESVWSLQKTRRDVVLQFFVRATDELTHCNQEYFRGTESTATKLELLIEVNGGAAKLMYAVGESKPEFPPGMVACVERALEKVQPVTHPGLAGTNDTRWRMGLNFLFHPPLELPPARWWDRFVPDSWKSGGNSSIHVG
ncbi:MAG: hypothetical protein JNM17_29540 [Archangium sp.]|nr:hypothetical protein [Archangium sp.]